MGALNKHQGLTNLSMALSGIPRFDWLMGKHIFLGGGMVGMVIDPKGKYGTPIRPCTRTPMPGAFDHSTQATPPPATSCEPPEVRDVLRQELPAQSSRRGPGYSPVPWLSSGRKIVHRLLDRQHWAVGRVKNVGGRRVPLRAP